MTTKRSMTGALPLLSLAAVAGAGAAAAAEHPVALTQDPLVMRLSKDEFRIAFGLNATQGPGIDCNGSIRYRVDWKTEDGTRHSEVRQVSYAVSPAASRAITVDRQYFDTAEGQHTTEVLKVTVDRISCRDAGKSRAPHLAALTR
jgi:hypothetical protein